MPHQSGLICFPARTMVLAAACALQLAWAPTADAKPRDKSKDCTIARTKFPNGALNPANPCQSCQGDVIQTAWTNLSAGSKCGGPPHGACDAQDTCDGRGLCVANYDPPSTLCREAGRGG